MSEPLSIGMCAQVACILDVVAMKPGNVSLAFSFADMTAGDFLLSAAAIAPVLEQAPFRPIGITILECIRATRQVTSVNTNLGIVLLLAPLASVQPDLELRAGIGLALARLDVADARATYEAIRLAHPGGLGTVAEQDVAHEPTVNLREAMALAAHRDNVARQYANDFEQVFEGVEILREELSHPTADVETAVVRLYIRLLAKYPDSLIVRKLGLNAAEAISTEARRIVQSKWAMNEKSFQKFDSWLRQKWNQLGNPGTTADLVTASLFVALKQNIIQLPLNAPLR